MVAVFPKLLIAHSCSWKTPLSPGNKLQVQSSFVWERKWGAEVGRFPDENRHHGGEGEREQAPPHLATLLYRASFYPTPNTARRRAISSRAAYQPPGRRHPAELFAGAGTAGRLGVRENLPDHGRRS